MNESNRQLGANPQPRLLDAASPSGNQREDKLANITGKLKWTLLPWSALKPCVRALEYGEKGYGPDNWKRVDNAREVYRGSLLRHTLEFADGHWEDPDTGLPHLAHAVCNALFLIWLEANNA